MRDKARHGTEKVQRTFRNRSLRIGIGLAVVFAFGLMASGAFGETLSVLGTTSTDTTAASSDATTDTTSAPSTDTSSDSAATTDASSSSTVSTASVPYIATFKSGVSDEQQQADIVAANGTAGDAIAPLHMYSLTFPSGEDSTDADALAANSDVASV